MDMDYPSWLCSKVSNIWLCSLVTSLCWVRLGDWGIRGPENRHVMTIPRAPRHHQVPPNQWLGGVSPWSFPSEFTMGWPSLCWVRLGGWGIKGPKSPYARGEAPSLEIPNPSHIYGNQWNVCINFSVRPKNFLNYLNSKFSPKRVFVYKMNCFLSKNM